MNFQFKLINFIISIGIFAQISLIYFIISQDSLTNKILVKFEELIKTETKEELSSLQNKIRENENKLKMKDKELKNLNKNKDKDKMELNIKSLPIEIKIYDKNNNLRNEYILPNWAIGLSVGDRIEIQEGK